MQRKNGTSDNREEQETSVSEVPDTEDEDEESQ